MERTEDWAVESSRIETFFRLQQDLAERDGGFRFRSCHIRLERLPDRKVGALYFPQTRISFSGAENDLNQVYHRFFMRFISAGG